VSPGETFQIFGTLLKNFKKPEEAFASCEKEEEEEKKREKIEYLPTDARGL